MLREFQIVTHLFVEAYPHHFAQHVGVMLVEAAKYANLLFIDVSFHFLHTTL